MIFVKEIVLCICTLYLVNLFCSTFWSITFANPAWFYFGPGHSHFIEKANCITVYKHVWYPSENLVNCAQRDVPSFEERGF